jgi:hypothetical protein
MKDSFFDNDSSCWKEYHKPWVSFHIDKTNNEFFQKNNSFLKFEIIEFFIIYYDFVTWIVKLFRV